MQASLLDSLTEKAFTLSTTVYTEQETVAIPILDPPVDGLLESEGLVYQESNAIKTVSNCFDELQFYGYVRPRAALDKTSFNNVLVKKNNSQNFTPLSYDITLFNFADPLIQPPIDTSAIPDKGRVLTRLIIGHAQSNGEWPQYFDINANGYARFNGAGQISGSSFRIALHNVFDTSENYPRWEEIYVQVSDTHNAELTGVINSEAFTGAVQISCKPGYNLSSFDESSMEVKGRYFARQTISPQLEPYTGFVGYSSMFWKDENSTTQDTTDEAHDCDWLVIGIDTNDDGIIDRIVEHQISIPANSKEITVTQFSQVLSQKGITGKQIYAALENRDRDSTHYTTYADATYHKRSSYSIEIHETTNPVSFILHEENTSVEYNDNIVLTAGITKAIGKSASLNDSTTIHYTTRAYFPVDSDGDGLTNQLERLIGTDSTKIDSDNDGMSDYEELLDQSNGIINKNTGTVSSNSNSSKEAFIIYTVQGRELGKIPSGRDIVEFIEDQQMQGVFIVQSPETGYTQMLRVNK